jgi:hypothetical protein
MQTLDDVRRITEENFGPLDFLVVLGSNVDGRPAKTRMSICASRRGGFERIRTA